MAFCVFFLLAFRKKFMPWISCSHIGEIICFLWLFSFLSNFPFSFLSISFARTYIFIKMHFKWSRVEWFFFNTNCTNMRLLVNTQECYLNPHFHQLDVINFIHTQVAKKKCTVQSTCPQRSKIAKNYAYKMYALWPKNK